MAKQPAKRTGTARKPGPKAATKPAEKSAPRIETPKNASVSKVETTPEIAAVEPMPVAEPAVADAITATTDEPADTPAAETKGPETMDEAMTKVKAEAETLIAKAKEYASDFGSKAKGAATELGTFTKGNFEAVVESGKIASEGTTSIAKDNMAFTKKSVEDFASTAKEMAAIKSPSEFVKTQGEYIRKSFDENMAQMTKSTEAFMKLMGDAYQPISSRVSVATEKMKTVA